MGKSTISMATFNSYVSSPEGIQTITVRGESTDSRPTPGTWDCHSSPVPSNRAGRLGDGYQMVSLDGVCIAAWSRRKSTGIIMKCSPNSPWCQRNPKTCHVHQTTHHFFRSCRLGTTQFSLIIAGFKGLAMQQQAVWKDVWWQVNMLTVRLEQVSS